MNKKIKKTNKFNSIMFILVCAFVLSFTVGYAALNRDLKISGEGTFRPQEDTRITDIELSEVYDAVENYGADYTKNTIKTGLTLNTSESGVMYKVEITNFGNVAMYIDSVEELINNNESMMYAFGMIDSETGQLVDVIQQKTYILPGEKIELYFIIAYVSTSLPENKSIDLSLKLNFKKPESILAESTLQLSEDGSIGNIEDLNEFISSPFFNGTIARNSVESIKFLPTLDVGEDALGYWDASYNKDGSVIAWYTDTDSNGLYEVYIGGNGEVYLPEDSFSQFFGFNQLNSIDFTYINTNKVTDMSYMFTFCTKLTELNLSTFDTSKVNNMTFMFTYCPLLNSINTSSFNTSNVTNMGYMFNATAVTELNLSNFNTSKVTDMSSMFYECSSLTDVNLLSFDTSKVTTMQEMFQECSSLVSLDLPSFNTDAIENTGSRGGFYRMFWKCTNLENLNISNFNLTKLNFFDFLLLECTSLKVLDLRNVVGFDASELHLDVKGITVYVKDEAVKEEMLSYDPTANVIIPESV